MKRATLLLITLLAVPAWAADFTFNVPLNITRLPAAVTGIQLQCTARSAGSGPAALLIGHADTPVIAIGPDGSYSGSVRVEFNASPGMNAADAIRYVCMITDVREGAVTRRATSYGSPAGVTNALVADGSLRP